MISNQTLITQHEKIQKQKGSKTNKIVYFMVKNDNTGLNDYELIEISYKVIGD